MNRETWDALLASQSGVVTRAQAIACGWHRQAVAHRVGRSWTALLPGVLMTSTGTPTWDQRAWAAVLRGGPGAALTSRSGLAVHGLLEHEPDVHVAVPWRRQVPSQPFQAAGGELVVHRTTRRLDARGSLPVLSVARCVTDACLALGRLNDVRAVVSRAVQQSRTTVELLLEELEHAPQRGSGQLRRALDEVSDGARSAPEAALARALRGAVLPSYRLNADVRDERGTWLARGDLVIEELKLLVELDGQRWHLSADRWVADVERHTRLEAAGWTVLRYPAARVLRDPGGVVAEIEAVAARLAARAA